MKTTGAVFVLAMLLAAAPAVAQQPAPGPAAAPTPKVGCLHGAPAPVCSTFWLVELQASTPLFATAPPEGSYRDDLHQFEWNLGHMKNLDDHWALGGTVSVGSSSDDLFTAAKARVRRWLGSSTSIEVEAGIARSNANGSWYPAVTGLSAGARFNIQDWGSVFVRYDGFGAPENQLFVGPDPLPVEQTAQNIVRGGIGLGGIPALVGTGVVVTVYAVIIGVLLASEGAR